MSQVDNNPSDMLKSLADTAGKMSQFLSKINSDLTPEQRQALDKELGGPGGFNSKMNKVNDDMAEALQQLSNFNIKK